VDTHAVEVAVGAVVVAGGSGFLGAYISARKTAKHDRIERTRTRRIEAADHLVQAWAKALFSVGGLFRWEGGLPGNFDRHIAEADADINAAVMSSVRVDLLFGILGLIAKNANALRDEARAAIRSVQDGDFPKARAHHEAASLAQTYLVSTLSEAIESTGTRSDPARKFKTVLDEPDADPKVRAAQQ
jgi:hypothetical protein